MALTRLKINTIADTTRTSFFPPSKLPPKSTERHHKYSSFPPLCFSVVGGFRNCGGGLHDCFSGYCTKPLRNSRPLSFHYVSRASFAGCFVFHCHRLDCEGKSGLHALREIYVCFLPCRHYQHAP